MRARTRWKAALAWRRISCSSRVSSCRPRISTRPSTIVVSTALPFAAKTRCEYPVSLDHHVAAEVDGAGVIHGQDGPVVDDEPAHSYSRLVGHSGGLGGDARAEALDGVHPPRPEGEDGDEVDAEFGQVTDVLAGFGRAAGQRHPVH